MYDNAAVDYFTLNDEPIVEISTDEEITTLTFNASKIKLSLKDLKRLTYMLEYHANELNTDNFEITIF